MYQLIEKCNGNYFMVKDMTGGSIYEQMGNSDNSVFYGSTKDNSISGGGVYKFYRGMVSYVPYIVIFSIVIGFILFAICRKNKTIQRIAVFLFILGIPLLCLLFVFGFGFLCGMFS